MQDLQRLPDDGLPDGDRDPVDEEAHREGAERVGVDRPGDDDHEEHVPQGRQPLIDDVPSGPLGEPNE